MTTPSLTLSRDNETVKLIEVYVLCFMDVSVSLLKFKNMFLCFLFAS